MPDTTVRNVAILGSGEMGSAVASCLNHTGLRTRTCLAGRSEQSRKLASVARLEDAGDISTLVAESDVFLSIVPPAAAVELASEICAAIAQSPNDTLFVDCNAIAPKTTSIVAQICADHEVRFQDVGIIGASPRPGRTPVRFYTSGPFLGDMQQLATELIQIKDLGNEIGRASAIKMVYASLTKGTHALRIAAALLGEHLGVGDEIREEWQDSLPDVYQAMQYRIQILAPVAGRWTGEMREIAETYKDAGLPPSFHEGAESIYEFLAQTELAAESRDEANDAARTLEELLRLLRDAHAVFVANHESADA